MIISIDFDGTIASHRFPKIGLPAPGAFLWMKRFQELGAKLILLTMRDDRPNDGPYLTDAVEFCRKHGVTFWAHNDNPEQSKWTGSRKIYSHIHIDDTNACCPTRPAVDTDRPIVDWDVVGPWVEGKILQAQGRR